MNHWTAANDAHQNYVVWLRAAKENRGHLFFQQKAAEALALCEMHLALEAWEINHGKRAA